MAVNDWFNPSWMNASENPSQQNVQSSATGPGWMNPSLTSPGNPVGNSEAGRTLDPLSGSTPSTQAQTQNPSTNNVVNYYEMPDKATQDMLAAQGKTIKIVPRGSVGNTINSSGGIQAGPAPASSFEQNPTFGGGLFPDQYKMNPAMFATQDNSQALAKRWGLNTPYNDQPNWGGGTLNNPMMMSKLPNGAPVNLGMLMDLWSRHGGGQGGDQAVLASLASDSGGTYKPPSDLAGMYAGIQKPTTDWNKQYGQDARTATQNYFNQGGAPSMGVNGQGQASNIFGGQPGNSEFGQSGGMGRNSNNWAGSNNAWLNPSQNFNANSFSQANPLLAALMGQYNMGQSPNYSNPFQSNNSFFQGYQRPTFNGFNVGNNPFGMSSNIGSWGGQNPFGANTQMQGMGSRANNSLYF